MKVTLTRIDDEKAYGGLLVCPDCFGKKGLKRRIAEIRPEFQLGRCGFHPRKKGIPVEEVAEILQDVIENNFHQTGYDYEGEPLGELLIDVIYELSATDENEVAEAIQEYLIENDRAWPPDGEEPFFQRDVGYDRVEGMYDGRRSSRWNQFCSIIVNKQRFFNLDAKEALVEIFDGLQMLRNDANLPAVRYLEPAETKIYRARVVGDNAAEQRIATDPAVELGAPPRKLRRAGRMNPSGIRAFYGSFDSKTCLAEIRPLVGEKVMSAGFQLTRPVLVLDTTVFSGPPRDIDIFNRTYNERLSLWGFMQEFMSEISRPTLPSDEHLDYITTQVVAEYLVNERLFTFDGKDCAIEGIMFRSAQQPDGKNIVLFGAAANVEGVEDQQEEAFWFSEKDSVPALRLSKEDLSIRLVTGVNISATEYYSEFSAENDGEF